MNSSLIFFRQRFPEWRNNSNQPVAGIIVLGGTFGGQKSPGTRVQVAIQLAQRFPSARVVFSGMEETAGAAGADAAVEGLRLDPNRAFLRA